MAFPAEPDSDGQLQKHSERVEPGHQAVLSPEAMTIRRAEEELRQSEERYRELVESLEDLVFSANSNGIVEYASTAASRYGYQPNDLIGRRITDFIHPDDLQIQQESFRRTLAGDTHAIEFRFLDASGRSRPTRSRCQPALRDGEAVGVRGILVDLTTQRAMENQLRAAQKMEAVGRLAGGVAHDFNNLLSVVLSYAGFVLDEIEEGNPMRDDVLEICQAAERGASLTRQLLAFSRKQILKPEKLDLNRLMQGVEKMLKRVLGEDIDLAFIPASQPCWTHTDPGQMEQAILALAMNARDAMPDGGKLTIETGEVVLDSHYTSMHGGSRSGPHVVLAVTDTGPGLEPHTLENIFDPYSASTSGGLGLATVYGIVKQSEGCIYVYSERRMGTTFKIYLPTTTASPIQPMPPRRECAGTEPETVMVVEDDEDVCLIVARILETAGFRVISCSDPTEGIRLFEVHRSEIRLVLTDVVMPGMSGPDFVRQIQGMGSTARVLYMSGYADCAIVRHGVLAPENHYITKPFSMAGLLQRVRELLDAP